MNSEATELEDKTFPIKDDTKAMLADITARATTLLEEFSTKKKIIDDATTRQQAIQLEVHGLSSTADYLLKREALKHGANAYSYNRDNSTITVKIKKNGSEDESSESKNPGGESTPS